MLAILRRSLDSWIVRGLFLLLCLAFVLWGIGGDMLRSIRGGGNDWAARVGSRTVTAEELREAYQRQLAGVTRALGGKIAPTPEMRRSVAFQALQNLVLGQAVAGEEARLGVVVPKADLQQAILEIPQFRGSDGRYDPAVARQVLSQNNLTETQLFDMIRSDAGERQVLGAVRAGAFPSDSETKLLFAYQREKRSADFVEVPFTSGVAPEPTDADLHRYYDNHPDLRRTPEYRHVKAVVLSVETVGKSITVSDEELKKAYEANRDAFKKEETRSVQLLTTEDEAAAQKLAAAWQAGADWPAMQKMAQESKANAFELPDADRAQLPVPALAKAVFAASPDTVPAPEHDDLGWHVFRVTKITPGRDISFDQAKDELRTRIVADRAGQQIFDDANKLDNILASGTSLDELPNDLGLQAATGTLDAAGRTTSGREAPIPGSPALRKALVAAAFAAHVGEPPHLQEVPAAAPGGAVSYFAVTVDKITPPTDRPYAEVADAVRAAWTADARRHAANERATGVFTAVQDGATLADAAQKAGLTVRRSLPTSREAPPQGFPLQLVRPLFSLKPKEVTMVQTGDAYLVALPAEIMVPDPSKDPEGYASMRDQVREAMARDTEVTFATAVRDRAGLQVNPDVVQSMIQ